MSATAGPFLRPTHPQRRRRRSAVVRAALRIARVLPGVLLPLGVWVWLTDGSTFALSAVETDGSPRIPPGWIEQALEPELGRNLLALPLSRVRERLEQHPWLGRIEARKELPDRLRVVVEERVAAAVLETEEGLFYVDQDGRRIAPLGPEDSAGTLVRIAAGATASGMSPALATGEVSSIRRALDLERELATGGGPSWSTPALWIEVIGDDDFRLYAGELPFSIVLRSAGAAERIEVLERLRPAILERVETIAEVDLRFELRVIVRPGEPLPDEPESEPLAESDGDLESSEESPAPEPKEPGLWDPQPKET